MDPEKMVKITMENLERRCEELERTQGLTELDKLKLEEKLKESDEECEKLKEKISGLTEEHNKMIDAKSKIISKLNKELSKLEYQTREKDRTVVMCYKTFDNDETSEIENLKRQKLEGDLIIEELRSELSESELRQEKLREKIIVASETLQQSRHQLLAAEMLAMRLDDNMKKMKLKQLESDKNVDELRQKNSEASRIMEQLRGQILAAQVQKKMSDQAMEEMRRKQSEYIQTVEALRRRIRNSIESGGSGSRLRGDRNLLQYPQTKQVNINNDNAVQSSPVVQSTCYPSADVADLCTNLGVTKIDCMGVYLSRLKRKQSKLESEVDNLPVDGSNYSSYTHELQSGKRFKTWMFGADMLKAFEEDDELCMNAVCTLYRQQIFASDSQSTTGSNGVFNHFQAMSGHVLAEYLINGDPELRLRKSVSEVKQQFPDVLNQCRRLARDYYEYLFILYCNRKYPFFGSR